jgi:2-keto-4-pentenoate hydratase/2-oxohepta-3-ene-1,7-dioic acid hydratase in catechol pathway
MINRTLAITITAVVFVAMGGAYWGSQLVGHDAVNESAVRAVVLDFGMNLQKVSVMGPNAADEMAKTYKNDITPELLALWQSNPRSAPGRVTSSPWPDHIIIKSLFKQQIDYEVEADIILEDSSTNIVNTQNSIAGSIPIHLSVAPQPDGRWLISRFQSP